MSSAANAFDIKSASLDLLALHLKTHQTKTLLAALKTRFNGSADHHSAEAFILDLEGLPQPAELDLAVLLPAFAERGVRVVALRHPNPELAELASRHGLAYTASNAAPGKPALAAAPTMQNPVVEPTSSVGTPAMIIDKPVRAGQQFYARGSDLVVLAMVSAGAEVIADGNIHIYAPLRGRALAGARGNTSARIFTQSMEAELISIAGVYRTIEQALPPSIKGKPSQIYLENERLVISALGE
jgi:septum site-determining protein MinC